MGAIQTLHKRIINRQAIPEGHVVKGSIVRPQYQYEAHKNIEIVKSGNAKKAIIHATNYPKLELDLDFLPAAAESYHISSNPEDYIVVSLPIVTCSVPNRNLQCFPIEEVSHFDPLYGQMVYETFRKKPCNIDHVNEDPTKAKGVHVDASMQYVPKYDLWKINVLTIWDRSKDPKLVKDILSKKRKGYSMGATVSNFICSVCGKIDNMDAHSCEHMKNLGSVWGENKRLAMQLCTGVCYFETSNLENEPADPTAYSEDIFV
jgi:hypothetical protein